MRPRARGRHCVYLLPQTFHAGARRHTDIGEAYRRFFRGAHLGMADARAIALNAVNAAWLDEPHRAQLRQSFEDEIDALTRAFGGK